jgi:hypothetical protein
MLWKPLTLSLPGEFLSNIVEIGMSELGANPVRRAGIRGTYCLLHHLKRAARQQDHSPRTRDVNLVVLVLRQGNVVVGWLSHMLLSSFGSFAG